ncbi:MAG: DNA polymerase I [Candidatus Marinimicrobia bacterium]|nr:DNA polymerase I [Candidatus Neomarinimicrobiota bacterium]|tara:strand:- start:8790 stop:11510 length:2721 start_codon:yes stop_codon:yes gene_type:complete
MLSSNSDRKRLFLIDGYAMLYRCHFALIRNPLITTYGLHTSALFGFTNQVLRLMEMESPDYIGAIFDSKEKTFRHEYYPSYKATREKMPEELVDQLPHLWRILKGLNIFFTSKPGFEADDIVGTLAKTAVTENLDTYIVSGDKDFMQLVNDQIFLFSPGGARSQTTIYDKQKVEERWGVPPESMIDLLGLMGDSSDNIPGVRGVGEKSAQKLIHEYGSLESALEQAEKVNNKRVRNGLLDYREDALLSKELVKIHTDVPLEFSMSDLIQKEFNHSELLSLFKEFEFYGLIRQFSEMELQEETQKKKTDKSYTSVISADDLNQFISKVKDGEWLSIDLETTSVNPMEADIVGMSFSVEKDSGIYIPIQHKDKSKSYFGKDELSTILNILKPVLENPKIPKTGQNIKYDLLILRRLGIIVKGIEFDTMIAAHLLNPEVRSYKLDKLSEKYLNYSMMPIEDLVGTGKNQISMAEVSLEDITFYAAEDADIALQLTIILKEKLEQDNLWEFFTKVEISLIRVLIEMEFRGTFVQKELLDKLSEDYSKKIKTLIADIYSLSGTEFNVNSTQQLAQILFDIIKLPQIRKRSTAEDVLKRLKNDHPLPQKMLSYRKLNKLKNTYLDPLTSFINQNSGRIHTSFNQTIAATGRLSSTNPNFQNIPIRTDQGREIRRAFMSQKKGWKIFSADYSQIELRIMAHLSQDKGLIEAFNNEEDIHTKTASSVYGISPEDVLPELRRTAKVINFGIMYGAGPFRIGQELGIPRNEAMMIIEAYFNQYTGIKNYFDKTINFAKEHKYVSTLLGRRRPVWEIDSDNRIRREAAVRMAINMPIQGTAAEMIKLAMIDIQQELESKKLESMMVLQIHDELVFEFPENELEPLKNLIVSKMENALSLSVPLLVDCGWGKSWYEAH